MPDLAIYGHTIVRNNLTHEEEMSFGWKIQRGLRAARQLPWARSGGRRDTLRSLVDVGVEAERMLITSNLTRAFRWAAKACETAGNTAWRDEAFGYAQIGLLKAARKYDPRRGTRFSTVAGWWIRQAISDGFRVSGHMIKPSRRPGRVLVPVQFFHANNAYGEAISLKTCEQDQSITLAEVSEATTRLREVFGTLTKSLSQ